VTSTIGKPALLLLLLLVLPLLLLLPAVRCCRPHLMPGLLLLPVASHAQCGSYTATLLSLCLLPVPLPTGILLFLLLSFRNNAAFQRCACNAAICCMPAACLRQWMYAQKSAASGAAYGHGGAGGSHLPSPAATHAAMLCQSGAACILPPGVTCSASAASLRCRRWQTGADRFNSYCDKNKNLARLIAGAAV